MLRLLKRLFPRREPPQPIMEPLRETTEKEESVAAAGAPWIGVDLDGTLARSGSWQGPQHIGKPVPLMLERVKLWLSQGYEVKIMTARASVESYIPPVKEWLKKHGLPELEVTNQKDFDMIELWDDRGVQVIPNTGRHVLRPSFLTNPKAPPLPYESNEETCFVEPRQAPPQVEARQDGAGEGKVGEGPGQS